jgi:hypothetical protein
MDSDQACCFPVMIDVSLWHSVQVMSATVIAGPAGPAGPGSPAGPTEPGSPAAPAQAASVNANIQSKPIETIFFECMVNILLNMFFTYTSAS